MQLGKNVDSSCSASEKGAPSPWTVKGLLVPRRGL